jgi:hypothetical protein
VFLIGALGVLSLFPVAMSTAGKSIGETRATILAQSALAQLKFDCTRVYERGTATAASTDQTLVRSVAAPARPGFYVTIVSGFGAGQCRRIAADNGLTITLDGATLPSYAPPGDRWNATPNGTSQFVITRAGLPDAAAPYFLNGSGQNRNLAIRSFVPENGLCLGYPVDPGPANIDPFRAGSNTVNPFIGDANTGATVSVTSTTITDTGRSWVGNQFRNYVVRLTQQDALGQTVHFRKVASNDATTLTVNPGWPVLTGGGLTVRYEVGMVGGGGTWTRWITSNTAASGTLSTLTRNGAFAAPNTPTRAAQGEVCYVVLRAGRGEGQARMISASTNDTITVTPDFNVAPDATTVFDIFAGRAYLLITGGRAAGRIYPIAGDYYSGRHNTEGIATTIGAAALTYATGTWPAGGLAGGRVRLRNGPASGQVRLITGNTATSLTVSPNWNPLPAAPPAFETSPGWLLYCANADFARHNVTACERPNASAAGFGAALQDGAACSVIGVGSGTFPSRAILPVTIAPSSDVTTLPPPIPINVFNVIGGANRTAPDTYGNSDNYTSEYSCIAVFSDDGNDPRDAVRADVFVYRNFNPAKELSDNTKPAGYVSGYIERP